MMVSDYKFELENWGVVDEMLPFDRKVSYEDLARAAAGNAGAEPPSILKSIFHDASGNDGLLTAWLVSDARDSEIVSKEATRELTKLVKARLGLDLVADSPLAKLSMLPKSPLERMPGNATGRVAATVSNPVAMVSCSGSG